MPNDVMTAAAPLTRRAAAFVPSSFNREARTVDVVWTTGADVMRTDWWSGDRWVESLTVSDEAVDLARLNAGAPVLNAHSSHDLADVIGVVERAWLENGRGMATLRLSQREEVAALVEDIAAGVIRNISVGYAVHEWRESSEGGLKRRTATRWQPMEISFVPIPADAAAQVRAAGAFAVPAHPPADPAIQETRDMTDQVTAAPATPDADAIRADVLRAERARAAELHEIARLANLDAAWVEQRVADGTAPDAARREALSAVASRQAPPTQSVHVMRDEGETRMRGVEGALAARLGAGEWEGPATDFRSATLVDLARATLEVRGMSVRNWSRGDIARAALGLPVMGRSMQTTSDFVALLANVQSKRLLASYGQLPRNFLRWCARRALPDFKTTQIVELGAAPSLRALAEGGQIELGAMQDQGETYSLLRYARNVSLSYPAIVNDDLGGFDRVPAAFAVAAANLENQIVYDILGNNPTMSDSVALFNAAHSNTSAQAMTVDGVSALRSLIVRQTDPTGQRIMIMPSVLIVPTELAATAYALFSPVVVPNTVATTAVNPWRGAFEIVETPFLSDANDYFMTVAAGTGYEAVEVGYEAGNEAPQLTSYVQPDVDGVVFSLRHSFGAKAATWRTIARATA